MITCKTATPKQWQELMVYLRKHYKSDLIELSDYLIEYDYSAICEALTEYGIEDWLLDNGLFPRNEYDAEYLDLTDFEYDWPYYEEAIQESKLDDLTANYNDNTYAMLIKFASEADSDWPEFFDEKFTEMLN